MLYQHVQGEKVPALGFGTWKLTGSECREAVRDALDIGYRHIDTAQVYDNETEVGEGWKAAGIHREEFFLTTKVWIDKLDATGVQTSTHESLRRLGTDYVDLLLIHWPADNVPLDETLEAMFSLRDGGKVRHVGVSNFTTALLKQATAIGPIFCNQVEYHPFLNQQKVLGVARAHDMLLTAYSPLVRGSVGDNATLQDIGRSHGKTASQVTLRWLIQQPGVAAIPKAASPAHRRANLDIFDFSLSDDEMTQIRGLARGYRRTDPDMAPDWD